MIIRKTTVVTAILAIVCVGVFLAGYIRMLRAESRTQAAALTALAEDTRSSVAEALKDPNVPDEATCRARIVSIIEKSSRAIHPTPQISIDRLNSRRQCKLTLKGKRSLIVQDDGSIVRE